MRVHVVDPAAYTPPYDHAQITGIAASHWVSGAVMAGLLLVLLALLEVVRRRATRDWQRMQDSALAVPAPLELWSETERQQLRRRRRVTPGRLESLPMLNGMSALSLLWQAGQGGATAAALDALTADRPDLAVVDVRMPPTFTDEGIRAAVLLRRQNP